MTTEYDPLELELHRIQPTDAPEGLRRRLASVLDAPPVASRRPDAARRGAMHALSHWLAWGVAAAMTLAYFSRGSAPVTNSTTMDRAAAASGGADTSTPASAAPHFSPVSSSNILLGTRDEGVVFLEDGRPARKVRYEFMDTINLQGGEAGQATLQVSSPREEIRLVPLQTL